MSARSQTGQRIVAPRSRSRRFRPAMDGLECRALMSYGGSRDIGFGPGAVGNLSIGTVGASISASDEAVQADGKVVVANSNLVRVGMGGSPGTSYFTVTRLLAADGTPDPSFRQGTGAGIPQGRVELFPTTSFTDHATARAVAIQADGKIVAVGDVAGQVEVVRLNADGSLDTSFNKSGSLAFRFGNLASSEGNRVAIQADGKILVGGFGQDANGTPTSITPAVARINADGSVDTSFGNRGQVVLSFPKIATTAIPTNLLGVAGLVVQPDGKIVVDGTSTSLVTGSNPNFIAQIVVSRLNADGTPDSTFGTSGSVTLPTQFAGTSTLSEVASMLVVQADGKLVAAGSASVPAPTGSTTVAVPFAARLNANGSFDTSFAVSGAYVGTPARATLPAGLGSPVGAAIQADGKLVLGAGGTSSQAIFLRLGTAGTLDPGFGEAGLVRLAGVGYDSGNGGVALTTQPDGKILAGLANAVVRLLPRGASGDFNNDGISDLAIDLTQSGTFAYRPSSGGPDVIQPFGPSGPGQSLPVPGAYDGNGITEPGVYLPAFGAFGVRPYPGSPSAIATNGADVITYFGVPGFGQTIPAPGDYDGSGKTELAVYLPNYTAFVYRPANGGPDVAIPFGLRGIGQTLPAPGDYFGTGQTDIAAYLPSLGSFALRDPRGGPDRIIPFGIAGPGQSIPMPGDYDGSGRTELAVYLPSLGMFAYRPANGGPDVLTQFGIAGAGQTLPAAGDYTGVGHDELGVYLPSLGKYAYRPGLPGQVSTSTPDVLIPFGIAGAGQTIPFNQASATTLSVSTASARSALIPMEPGDGGSGGLVTHKKGRNAAGG